MFLYLGCAIIILWGITHLRPAGGESPNRRDRLLQGVLPVVIGLAVLATVLLSGLDSEVCSLITKLAAGLLVVMAVVGLFLGSKTNVLSARIYPAVMTLTAVLFLLGAGSG
jgi:hypothetical protein